MNDDVGNRTQHFVWKREDRHRRRCMVNMLDAGREVRFGVPAMINGDSVIQSRKLPDEEGPDKLRAANHENPHGESTAQTIARQASDSDRDEHRGDRFPDMERR